MFFALYYSEELAGFAMMSYIRAQRIAILEYVALETQYRVNTVFFTYINLLESYLHINQYDVAFILNEVSNRRNGSDIDKESQIFSKLLCIEGFGKIEAPYVTPPLGTNNFESSFDAFLFAKSSGDVHALERQTYLEIVRSIYFDYFLVWYEHVLPASQLNEYNGILQKSFEAISRKLPTNATVPVLYVECPILLNNACNVKTTGLPPAVPKKPKAFLYVALAVFIMACPLAVVWGYNHVLNLLGIPIGSVNSILGSCLGACLTAGATLWIAKKKL